MKLVLLLLSGIIISSFACNKLFVNEKIENSINAQSFQNNDIDSSFDTGFFYKTLFASF